MSYMRSAHQSPAIKSGDLYFYRGDEFTLSLHLDTVDADGVKIELAPEDKAVLQILEGTTEILSREYTDIENNRIEFSVDSVVNNLLYEGKYRMLLKVHHGGTVTTLMDCEMIVR